MLILSHEQFERGIPYGFVVIHVGDVSAVLLLEGVSRVGVPVDVIDTVRLIVVPATYHRCYR